MKEYYEYTIIGHHVSDVVSMNIYGQLCNLLTINVYSILAMKDFYYLIIKLPECNSSWL